MTTTTAATVTPAPARRVSLEVVQIASPCTASWDEMAGDHRVRHCGQCDLNVFNISGMTRSEAESLIASRQGEGRLCIRMHRRQDGTVITQDCPVGLTKRMARAARRTGRRAYARAVAAGLALAGLMRFGCSDAGADDITLANPVSTTPAVTIVAATSNSSGPDIFERIGRRIGEMVDAINGWIDAPSVGSAPGVAGGIHPMPMIMGEALPPEQACEVLEQPAIEMMGDVAFPMPPQQVEEPRVEVAPADGLPEARMGRVIMGKVMPAQSPSSSSQWH